MVFKTLLKPTSVSPSAREGFLKRLAMTPYSVILSVAKYP